MIRRMRTAIALACLSIAVASAAHAQYAKAPLNVVPGVPEEVARVPSRFVWLRTSVQAVQDPLDGTMVLFDDDGRVLGRATLPAGFHIGEIVPEPGRVRLLDRTREWQVILPRDIDPDAVQSLSGSAVTSRDPLRNARLLRSSPQQLQIAGEGRNAGAELHLRSLLGGELAQAYEIGTGVGGERYVVGEEIVEGLPEITVRVFVHRFDATGRLTGIAHVSLDDMEAVPADFIAVTGEGVLRVLVPTRNGVTIREVAFSDPPPGVRSGEARAGEVMRLGRVAREIEVDSKVVRAGPPPRPRSDVPRFQFRAQTPPIERDRVLANARRYLSVNWILRRENYSRAGIENRCDPEQGRYWLRPTRFTPASIGTTFGPMPYKWGGFDTPERFKERIERGALAGDICTCRRPALDYCLVQTSAGVDCSGFVSRAWEIGRRGTAGLLDVTLPLRGLSELQPADALVIPNRHVHLVVGRRPGPALAFVVLEATVKRACEGVCESVYRPSELHGYRPVRYRGIVD